MQNGVTHILDQKANKCCSINTIYGKNMILELMVLKNQGTLKTNFHLTQSWMQFWSLLSALAHKNIGSEKGEAIMINSFEFVGLKENKILEQANRIREPHLQELVWIG